MTQPPNPTAKHSSKGSKPSVRLHWPQPLRESAEITLDEEAAHYLVRVLRLKTGAEVGLFNGNDGEWRCQIVEAGKKQASVTVLERVRAGSLCPALTLAFAPIRNERLSWLIEKAAELGVTKLVPVMTEYCQNRHPKLERLRKIAAEAAEQCERLDVPELEEPIGFGAFLDATPRLICAIERLDAAPLHALPSDALSQPVLFIGPEGGFSPKEQEALIAANDRVIPVTLGERLLRAETAAIAGLTLIQAQRGQMSLPQPDDTPS